MRVYPKMWLAATLGLRPETKGAYVSVAMYASEWPQLDAMVPRACVLSVTGWQRRHRKVERELEERALVEITNDGDWRLCEVSRTERWVFLGSEKPQWWGRAEPLLAIRPRGWADIAPKREPIPQDVRQRIIERDESTCGICGELVEDDLHIDHVVPVAAGGTNDFDNLQVAHAVCNLRKGASTVGVRE